MVVNTSVRSVIYYVMLKLWLILFLKRQHQKFMINYSIDVILKDSANLISVRIISNIIDPRCVNIVLLSWNPIFYFFFIECRYASRLSHRRYMNGPLS